MLFPVFIILAGYLSVKCDDASNYYLVEMPVDATTARLAQKPFDVYWNVPTMQCKSKRIPFTDLYEKYGIIQNEGDSFRGEKVAILYDPGLFPALLKNETSGKFKFRNGGVPQEGNITSHLDAFRSTVEKSIPDEKFDGIGIIDFESWRPIFRQNFGVLVPYKNVSVQIEKKLHWWWPNTWLQQEAKDRFEEAAQQFMQSTISVAKQMRPLAQWGYYGFPYCFNVATNNPGEACPTNVIRENNQIKWLWSESTSLYPSVYSSKNLTSKQLKWLVRGRVSEASRVRRKETPILPYFWFRYRDGGFLTEQDLDTVLETLYKSEATGFIIWGSSNDVNTVDKCNELHDYVNNTLGPAVAQYIRYGLRTKVDTTTQSYDIVTESGTTETTVVDSYNDTDVDVLNSANTTKESASNSTAINQNETINIKLDNFEIKIDPDFKFVPSGSYDGNIVQDVEDELNKKSEYNTTASETKDTDDKHNDLIEIFMNLMNSKIKTNSKIKGNSGSNNYYTSVPFLAYFAVPKQKLSDASHNNANVNMKEETKGIKILSDVILSGFTQNAYTTESSTSATIKDNDYNEVNTILYELNNLVENNENYTFVELNDTSAYTRLTTLQEEDSEVNLTSQNDLVDDDLETATQISTTNETPSSTTDLYSNDSSSTTEYIDCSNFTFTESETVEGSTENINIDAIDKDEDDLEDIANSKSSTPSSTASTDPNDDSDGVTEGGNLEDPISTSTDTDIFLTDNSTSDPNSGDDETELSAMEVLDNKLPMNMVNDDPEYNYTTFDLPSSPAPNKVPSNGALGSGDIIYTCIIVIYLELLM